MKEKLSANYWNNHWIKNPVTYNARNNKPYDVRSFIAFPSVVLQDIKLDMPEHPTEENIALSALKWVHKNIKYKSDEGEYWMYAEDTLYKRASDCEDQAILLISILLNKGISPYKTKVIVGWALNKELKKLVGHAYPIFLNAENRWVSLDTTFYPDLKTPVIKRRNTEELGIYGKIWFSFNNEFIWSPKENLTINDNRLKKLIEKWPEKEKQK